MLQLRPNCECCDRDLPPDSPEADLGVHPTESDGPPSGTAMKVPGGFDIQLYQPKYSK